MCEFSLSYAVLSTTTADLDQFPNPQVHMFPLAVCSM